MERSYWSRTTTQDNLPPALAFLAEPVRYPDTFIQQWCQYRPPNAYISDVAAVNSRIELSTRLFCSDDSGAQREATTLRIILFKEAQLSGFVQMYKSKLIIPTQDLYRRTYRVTKGNVVNNHMPSYSTLTYSRHLYIVRFFILRSLHRFKQKS